MTDLFCTPEQGKRLKKLLPELESAFMWASLYDGKWFITEQISITYGAFVEFRSTFTPALTLQELRDVARRHSKSFDELLAYRLHFDTAPELADWVIAKLEEQP